MRDDVVRLVLGLGWVVSAQLAVAAGPVQISSDPYTNADSQHQTQVEPGTFAYGSTLVAAVQTGRFFDGGASNVAWSTSQDGGGTWTGGYLPATTVNSTPAGPFPRVSDPSAAYDAKHGVWMIATLGFGGTTDAVLVSRSTDGGLTWDAPVTVSATTSDSYDKPWIACDNGGSSPFFGNCYATWDNGSLQILMSTSTDGGLTWGAGQAPVRAFGLGGQPVVQPNGQVIVPALDAFGNRIIVFDSSDGGEQWSRRRKIARVRGHDTAALTGLRDGAGLPSVAIDGAGTVYVAWADCRFRFRCTANDIVLRTSANGLKWSRLTRVPIDPLTIGVDHFIAGLAVEPGTSGSTAHLALTYYYYPNANCTVDTCELYAGLTASLDGGATWSAPQVLAGPMSLNWLALTDQGYMVGDYVSTAFSDGNIIATFASASAPLAGTLLQEALFAYATPVASIRQSAAFMSTQPEPVRWRATNQRARRLSLTRR